MKKMTKAMYGKSMMKSGGAKKMQGGGMSTGQVDRMNTNTTEGEIQKMKTGGTSKMKKYDDGGILTPEGRLKSKKVRDVSIQRYGDSSSTVSKTKKDGSTVTKKVTGTRGYVPTASMSKTVTDKEGNVVSNENKSIGYNKAVKKMGRVARNVGRNENDTWAYKTGGMVNSNAKVSADKTPGSKGVKSGTNPKASASKKAKGKVGGTSVAPKTATPKAMYGMSMKPGMMKMGGAKKK
jgi:hypothetical protein